MIRRLWIVLVLLVVLVGSAFAEPFTNETLDAIQNSPVPARDPVDLAVRLRGVPADSISMAERRDYQVGDTEVFKIGGLGDSTTDEKQFLLAAVSDDVYLWIERGINFDSSTAAAIVREASQEIFPRIREVFGREKQLASGDEIYILNVSSLTSGVVGVYFDTDSYPNEIFPSSNEIKSVVMGRSFNNKDEYLSTLAHEFQHMVQANQDDGEETWMIEGMAEVGSFLAAPEYYNAGFQSVFIGEGTQNQLTDWGEEGDRVAYYGGASLFLIYLMQQQGEEIISAVTQEPSDGVIGINKALTTRGATDTFDDVFADFVVANYLNDPTVGDGRFAHTLLGFTDKVAPDFQYNQYPVELLDLSVTQYGSRYIELNSNTAKTLTINFEGQATVSVIPTQPLSGEHFYWSQGGNQGNARLTGHFNLRQVQNATLTFWTWYDMEEFWDYGYLSVSTNNGATWHVLNTPRTTIENPYDRAFAAGYTGASRNGEPEPAPYIGIEFDQTMTVTRVVPGTPAEVSAVQVGDQLVAVNQEYFQPNRYQAVVDQYRPGQTAVLRFIRSGQAVDLDLTFAENPYRLSSNTQSWVQESIDLTQYAGMEILIRFDYVTDQAVSLNGWAIDNVAIPEINFFDDMETQQPAWESEGWARIMNALPQEYLLQLIETGEETTVTRLLEPGGGTSGAWTIELNPRNRAVLVISGMTPITTEPAHVSITITN